MVSTYLQKRKSDMAKFLPDKKLTAYRQQLVVNNVRLVYWHVGKRLKGFHQDVMDDAIAQCMLGLIRAAQLFDKNRKAERTGRPVKFGTYAMHWVRCFFQRWTDHRVKEGMHNVVQMSAMGAASEHHTQWEPACDARLAEDESNDADAVARLLRVLPKRLRLLMRLRFIEGLTLEETGAQMGVTRERVRQLEARAKARLRREHGDRAAG